MPFPSDRFLDRRVPGTAEKIRAFENRGSVQKEIEIATIKGKINKIPYKIHNNLKNQEEYIDTMINMGPRANFTGREWGEYHHWERELDKSMARARYLVNKETKLKMKLDMLRKDLHIIN